MDTKRKNLNDIKKTNPFVVPDGYFEQLTSSLMEQLPEKEPVNDVKITWMDRVRPWVYMAAVFAGLGLFFKFLVGPDAANHSTDNQTMVHQIVQIDEDEVYWDCLESSYADDILLDEIEESE